MEKLIIENRTDLPIDATLQYIKHVLEQGRISQDGQSYCFHTTFDDGVNVSAKRNLRSDTIVLTKEQAD